MFYFSCLNSADGLVTIATFTAVSILIILPLCVLVVFTGLQRWRSGAAMSLSDLLTYHAVAIELMNVFGITVTFVGLLGKVLDMPAVGIFLSAANLVGQLLIQTLTSVERHVAVVHPVLYRSLRAERWVRIRNAAVGLVWLVGFVMAGVGFVMNSPLSAGLSCCVVVFTIAAVSYCSFSVLCVLIRPGPGVRGGARQMDPSKLRAFYTLVAILGVVLLRLLNYTFVISLHLLQLHQSVSCGVMFSISWFSLPGSLLLPLLFLQREGKLLRCRNREPSSM